MLLGNDPLPGANHHIAHIRLMLPLGGESNPLTNPNVAPPFKYKYAEPIVLHVAFYIRASMQDGYFYGF